MAARDGQRLGLERPLALGGRHALQRLPGRHAGAVLVVQELDVAAQRDPGEAPARAVAVVEAEDLLAEADREGLDLARRTSAPPGNAPARARTRRPSARTGTASGFRMKVGSTSISAYASCNSSMLSRPPGPHQRRRSGSGHQAPRATCSPASSAPTRGPPRPRPARSSRSVASASRPRPSASIKRLGYKLGDLKELEPSGQEGLHRHLVGRVEHRRRHAAVAAWPGAPGPAPGTAPRRAARSSSCPSSTRSMRLVGRRHARRPGQARGRSACACRGLPAAPASSRRGSRPAHG